MVQNLYELSLYLSRCLGIFGMPKNMYSRVYMGKQNISEPSRQQRCDIMPFGTFDKCTFYIVGYAAMYESIPCTGIIAT